MGSNMIKKNYLLPICLLTSIYNSLNFAFSTPKFISRLWQKNEQEVLKKSYDIKPDGTLKIDNIQGNIQVKTWDKDKIEIEATKTGTVEDLKNTTLSVKSNSDQVSITTKVPENAQAATVQYSIMVPEKAKIHLAIAEKGTIKIEHPMGPVDVATDDGAIDITDSTNIVTAKNRTGKMTIKQKKFSGDSCLFLESFNGDIYLYLPRETKANLQAKTIGGLITSEYPVTLYPITMKLNKDSWSRIKKEVKGTLSDGGAPITIETTKSNIYINEY